MDEKTRENLVLAFAAGTITFIVTFATMHYVNPTIKKMF